jgi:hypothetical protein
MRKRKIIESISKDAHETSKKLYNKLISQEGLKPYKGDLHYVNSSDRRVEYTIESLQEALGDDRFNKITRLITECKKEGLEVSISIPKKVLHK